MPGNPPISSKPPNLSIHELYQLRNKKRNKQLEAFNKVLDMCHRRIRMAANTGVTDCFFEVPGMILGLPLYDHNECVQFVIDALCKSGLQAEKVPNNNTTLYITWHPQKVRLKQTIPFGK